MTALLQFPGDCYSEIISKIDQYFDEVMIV